MAWTTPITFTVGATLTASQLNVNLTANLNYFKGGTTAEVAASDTTASTTYVDLANVGPSITMTTDVQAKIDVVANFSTNAAGFALIGCAVSGATTIAASDDPAIFVPGTGAYQLGAGFLFIALTPGSNTFKLQYRVTAGTGSFSRRRISGVPA